MGILTSFPKGGRKEGRKEEGPINSVSATLDLQWKCPERRNSPPGSGEETATSEEVARLLHGSYLPNKASYQKNLTGQTCEFAQPLLLSVLLFGGMSECFFRRLVAPATRDESLMLRISPERRTQEDDELW